MEMISWGSTHVHQMSSKYFVKNSVGNFAAYPGYKLLNLTTLWVQSDCAAVYD